MRHIRLILLTLFLVLSPALAGADLQAYVYIHNWTDDDLQVYIDGQDYGVAYKGLPSWYYVTAGHHKIESYRVHNPWAHARSTAPGSAVSLKASSRSRSGTSKTAC